MEKERFQSKESHTKVVPYEESESDDEVKVINFEQDDDTPEYTLDTFIKQPEGTQKNEAKSIFEDHSKMCVAVDTSGSTSGQILEISLRIIHRMFDFKEYGEKLLKECISWNSSSAIMPLDKMTSCGGTSPETIFNSLKPNQSTLVITTDGEISSSSVPPLVKKVSLSNVIHTIAIYIGHRSSPPKSLNLPVFAPFMDVPGVFLLLHWDGVSLVLLLKKGLNQEFPDPPTSIDENTKWANFPVINPKDLHQISSSIQSKVLSSGEVRLSDGRILNINKVLEEANKNPSFISSTTFDSFVRNQLLSSIINSRNYHPDLKNLDNTIRQIAHIWQRYHLPKAEANAEKLFLQKFSGLAELQQQAATLLQRKNVLAKISGENLTDEIKLEKENVYVQYQQTLQKLYKLREENAKFQKEYDPRIEIEHIHAEIMSALNTPAEQPKSYDLASLVERNMGSNRAKRANIVSGKMESPDKWILDGDTFLGACSDCMSDNVPLAIVLNVMSEDHVSYNTNDITLNDPLSVGQFNMNVFTPGSELCLYCMDYIYQQSILHPTTLQPVKCYIVMADMCQQSNRRLMGQALSKALFGGAQLPIGFQIFLAILDSNRIHEKLSEIPNPKYSENIIRWWINSILNNTQGNFFSHRSDGGLSETLIDAMSTLMNHRIDRHDFESWAIQLRNRAVASMGVCSRMLLEFRSESYIPSDKYVGVMLRVVIRQIVNRFLSATKTENAMFDKIQATILSELYNTRDTSMPLRGSGHLASFVNSPTLKLLFGEYSYNILIKEITSFTKLAGLTMEQFISKQIFSTILFRLSKESFKTLNVTAENFIKQLVQDTSDPFSMCFGSCFFNDTKDVNVLPYIVNVHSNMHTTDQPHNKVPAFGPHLCGSYVTVCACCGATFVSLDDLKLINDWNAPVPLSIINSVKKNRTEHFVPIYKNKEGVTPTELSANCNLHRATLSVFHSNPSFITEKFPTREMINKVLIYLKKKKLGNIYEANLIESIILVLWDLLQRIKKGTEFPDPQSMVSFESRLKSELIVIRDTNKLFGIHYATLDGLSEELIKQLTSPFDL